MEPVGRKPSKSPRQALSEGLLTHVPLLLLLAALWLAELTLLGNGAERFTRDFGWFLAALAGLFPIFLAASGSAALMWRALTPLAGRPDTIFRPRVEHWAEILLLRVPLALGLVAAIAYLYFTFKVNIPKFGAFTWDPFLARVDRALFLGHDAWEISHRLFPGARMTRVFDAVYLMWYFVLFGSVLSAAVLPPRNPLRQGLLLALGLNWLIGGVVLASLLPAAGPVYMLRITGDSSFEPLMELLRAQAADSPIMALEIQKWLWAGYSEAGVDPAGISAFPSLHLAVITSCTCFGFATSRPVGWFMTAFTTVTLVASVHLGWHYAVDGIAGILLGVLLWWVGLRVARWWLAFTASGPAAAGPVQG